MRHPRQTRHHYAERHTACKATSGCLGWFGVIIPVRDACVSYFSNYDSPGDRRYIMVLLSCGYPILHVSTITAASDTDRPAPTRHPVPMEMIFSSLSARVGERRQRCFDTVSFGIASISMMVGYSMITAPVPPCHSCPSSPLGCQSRMRGGRGR